jgi:hypothetical protein
MGRATLMGFYARAIRRGFGAHRLAQLPRGRPKVKVGFPAGATKSEVIMRAIWNEFGTKGGRSGGGWGGPIPERPFLRDAMRENQDKYRSAMRAAARDILARKATPQAILRKLGVMAQGDVQKSITSLMSPPNSPVTIALKGSSKPLVDTGELRQAVTYKVEE